MLTDATCAIHPPALADLEAAAIRLAPLARATPLLESMRLNDRLGGRLLLKAESLQQTGSFKFRGALNRLSLIPLAKRQAGVVAFSSGNHAQGVAAAARLLGMPATILMPDDAPAMKIANTRDYGAEIVLFNRVSDNRETIGAGLACDRGAALIKPYDDGGIIAGQGTVGLEIALDCRQRHLVPNDVLVNCSGGGLAAGIALALAGPFPDSQIWTAEPIGFDDTARSLRSGRRQSNERNSGTICDALMANGPGELTLPLLASHGVQGVAVDDDTVKRAIHTAWRDFKLVVEPGGAVALAAALSGLTPVANRTVIAIASGGNIDAALFRACLELPPL